ncbi:glycosyltransferase [Hymenobacter wooponensis]|uniref:Glycosyltransferase n=1 Tax=Hymenobacter wooponensis TaxID=1525360 RepID=A0A4Z0MPI6_9BACT|nr:glycosyltransferase [Hymenobacter wooponensis]TGD81166.1 glycosyltransferase [Hymenobacter wooponensis]
MTTASFPEVTLLITHYNRSKSIERLLRNFADLGVTFGDIVVSDDGSKPVHQNALQELQKQFQFRLITTPVNKGLGNNLNKGQDAVTTPYTLYVQEDFVPSKQFTPHFQDAYAIMQKAEDIDIVRFYAYYAYPYLKPYGQGFSEMLYKPWYLNTTKIYHYSDHPHLRRSSFMEKFGRYKEGIKSDRTEYLMCLSFIQNYGKGLFYDNFNDLFTQENSAEEPSTVTRSNWRNSDNFLIAMIRMAFRQVKYNYDLHLGAKVKSA